MVGLPTHSCQNLTADFREPVREGSGVPFPPLAPAASPQGHNGGRGLDDYNMKMTSPPKATPSLAPWSLDDGLFLCV